MVSAGRLYLMRLDDLWASLFSASLPPAPGLTAGLCSSGRSFATRFFRLHLAATPCASLRLPSSAPIGSFHPIRFCPCWAHSAADALVGLSGLGEVSSLCALAGPGGPT